jgi:hypothetical protein
MNDRQLYAIATAIPVSLLAVLCLALVSRSFQQQTNGYGR